MKEVKAWKPVRKGKVYCSPACGRSCTFAEYKDAELRAYKCLSKLRNPKAWKVRVWENLGWFSSVSSKHITIYCEPGGYYWTLMNFDGDEGTGDPKVTPESTRRFKDPQKAVEYQLKLARSVYDSVLQGMEAALAAVGTAV